MIDRQTAGAVVINSGKAAITFQKITNSYSFPKGGVDDGESHLEAAIRETNEETGIKDLKFIKELGSYSRGTSADPNILKHITLFLFKTDQIDLAPIDENNTALWVAIDEIENVLSYGGDKEFFLSVKDELQIA